ncbi:MAG: tetratricopeptide repeat protein [Candidatus Omnitrophica bacterium]|nr:tetratricopeptide repeat protein [Candidatus Omnitrophota bacterium]
MMLNKGCKRLLGAALIALFVLYPGRHAQSEEMGDANLSPKDMIVRAWEAWGAKNYEKTFYWTDKCIGEYSEEAKKEQASLSDFPPTDIIDQYEALNAVGTSFFIQGEAYLSQGKIEEAKKAFGIAIKDYSFAQNWDPRGWYWSVKEKSQASIEKSEKKPDVAEEKSPKPTPGFKKRPSTTITLYDPGKEAIVDYKRYGYFKNVGTDKYAYIIKDQEGLSQAVGEAIHPNTSSVNWDPRYKKAKDEGRLEGNHWDFVNTDDLEANFYKWSSAPEPPGLRLFYIGLNLEKSGLLTQAIKAYYAIVVNFPKSVGWTYFRTPWYIAQVACDRIDFLLRHHPELEMEMIGAKVKIENGFDNDIANDRFIVTPGEIKKLNFFDKIKKTLFNVKRVKTGKVIKQIGDGKVDFVKYENGQWQLRVEGRPYIIKGVAYSPGKTGQSPDEGTMEDWMQADYNKNGKIDGPYDAWMDKNLNNTQDPDEKAVGDFQLLKEMGCNTIRLYHHASNKELLKELYQRYGIMVIMGDLLGAYTVGSGAGWYEGTDYANPEHKKNMLESVKKMVEEFKDEPYVLFWMLGNENNYGVANNAKRNPRVYYEFVNEAASMIKSMDRDHPVGICNGDLTFLDICSSLVPSVDIYGSNTYRGKYGFGASFWENVKDTWGKPVMITEYGCPAYMEGKSGKVAQEAQAEYLKNAWQDIAYNSAGSPGAGNSIGGMLFEWVDEWWKAYEPSVHDTKRNWSGPFPDGWNYEEWLGVCSQGDGKSSPFLRQLRKAYFTYKEMWNK